MWQKKLETDRFPWPRTNEATVIELSGRDLNWLLDGMDIFAMRPHGELFYESVL
jgi:transposase